MKINYLIPYIMLLFVMGCTISTTGNVVIGDITEEDKVIEDATEQPIEEEETEPTGITPIVGDEANITIEEEKIVPEIKGELINIENLKFVPDRITISKGETVTWKHNDRYTSDYMKHMVRIYPGGAASPIMFYGNIFSYTFNETGEYTIIDVIYTKKNVKGKVIVE